MVVSHVAARRRRILCVVVRGVGTGFATVSDRLASSASTHPNGMVPRDVADVAEEGDRGPKNKTIQTSGDDYVPRWCGRPGLLAIPYPYGKWRVAEGLIGRPLSGHGGFQYSSRSYGDRGPSRNAGFLIQAGTERESPRRGWNSCRVTSSSQGWLAWEECRHDEAEKAGEKERSSTCQATQENGSPTGGDGREGGR